MWQNEIEQAIADTARTGFAGIELFRQHVLPFLDDPPALKRLLDSHGVSLVSCSNGGAGMTVNFTEPEAASISVSDHAAFARDFIRVFGCRHFKINLGRRPPQGSSDDHLKILSDALNRLGEQTAILGLRLAIHPHLWSPVERETEVRRVMELTDPALVWLVTDTAHLQLGGMDPLQIMTDYFPRIAAVHFKDTDAKFRGWKGPSPTLAEHRENALYKNLGAGGVDFPAIYELLRARDFEGWITLDLDPPREGDGTIEENLEINKAYLASRLHVGL
ncbi:MAG: sugar phosphate isomerase/epimerase [Amphiplicatus sp.]